MTKDEMLALAGRVEAAEGGDEHLDVLIENACGLAKFDRDPRVLFGDADYTRRPPVAFTARVDAAAMLVPEGYDWAAGTGRRRHMTEAGRRPWAWCATDFDLPAGLTLAATPALALTAAALKALAAQENEL